MSVVLDIERTIDRLHRAAIPLDHLCYQLDQQEWKDFLLYVGAFAKYEGRDLSYLDEMTYRGLSIRKRAAHPASGEPGK